MLSGPPCALINSVACFLIPSGVFCTVSITSSSPAATSTDFGASSLPIVAISTPSLARASFLLDNLTSSPSSRPGVLRSNLTIINLNTM